MEKAETTKPIFIKQLLSKDTETCHGYGNRGCRAHKVGTYIGFYCCCNKFSEN